MSSEKSAAADDKPVAWRWKWKDSVTAIGYGHPLHGWQYSHGSEKPSIHSSNADFIDFDPLYTRPAATSNEAAPDWAECQRIADLPDVDAALLGFSEDPTGDNGVCVVRAIINAAPPAPTGEAVQPDAVVVGDLLETPRQRNQRVIVEALKKAKEDWTGMLSERSDRMDWFMAWFVKNYPADTIISDPTWHGPRILAAAEFAVKSHPAATPALLGLTKKVVREMWEKACADENEGKGLAEDILSDAIIAALKEAP